VQLIAGLRVKADHRTATTYGSPDTPLMVKAHSIWHPALLVYPHTLHFPATQHLLFSLGVSTKIEPRHEWQNSLPGMQNSTAFICTVVTAKLHAKCAYAYLPRPVVKKQSSDVGTQTNHLVYIKPSRATPSATRCWSRHLNGYRFGHLVCLLLGCVSSGMPISSVLYSQIVPHGGSLWLLMESLKYMTPFLLFQSRPFGNCTPSGPRSCMTHRANLHQSHHIIPEPAI